MPDVPASSSPLRAVWHWLLLSLIFIFAGGLGAGTTTLLYELIFPEPFGDVLYAVLFGGLGWIGYRTARPYVAGDG